MPLTVAKESFGKAEERDLILILVLGAWMLRESSMVRVIADFLFILKGGLLVGIFKYYPQET